jgi:hypothetical protein
MDEFLFKGIVHLGPKPADMHIHHVRVALEAHIPHLLGEPGSRKNFPGAGGEKI